MTVEMTDDSLFGPSRDSRISHEEPFDKIKKDIGPECVTIRILSVNYLQTYLLT